VGCGVGAFVGACVGVGVGADVGANVGGTVGFALGVAVGVAPIGGAEGAGGLVLPEGARRTRPITVGYPVEVHCGTIENAAVEV
jgi:hypothetical protein